MGSVLAEQLDAMPPGPDLAALVAGLEPADIDDDALLELVAATERLTAWAAALQARAVAEQVARTRSPAEAGYVAAGLCLRLGITKWSADKRVRLALACDRHPSLATALRSGTLDVDKTLALAETGAMPHPVREQVITALLPRAGVLTHRQLADQVRRAELLTDPHGAQTRHQRARADRSVRFDPTDDAMAWITAYLPADDATSVWATIDATARTLRAMPGETRTLDQCRADALLALTTGQVLLSPPDHSCAVRGEATCQPAPAPPDRPAITDPTPAAPTADPSVPLTAPRVPVPRVPVVQVGVLIAATTLAGLDDLPGEITGYGPVPADLAATLAHTTHTHTHTGAGTGTDTTWRRLLTDPVSGVLTDWSTTAYRPGRILRAAVEARDRSCTFIGCRQPATVCEHDHLTPYDHTHPTQRVHGHGQTCAHNLHPLCKHHHQLKTAGIITPTRDPATGTTTWTLTTTGHTATHHPDPLHPQIQARRLTATPPPETDRESDDPPF